MPRQLKRLPGDPNPQADRPVVNRDWAAGGHGNDYGIARGIIALLAWRRRRKAIKARQS